MDYSISMGSAPQAAPTLKARRHLYDDTVCAVKPRSGSLLGASGYLVDWAGRQVIKPSYVEACYLAERVTEILREEGVAKAEDYFYTA